MMGVGNGGYSLSFEQLLEASKGLLIELTMVIAGKAPSDLDIYSPFPASSFKDVSDLDMASGWGVTLGYRHHWGKALNSNFIDLRLMLVGFENNSIRLNGISTDFDANVDSAKMLRLTTNIGSTFITKSSFAFQVSLGVGGFITTYELNCNLEDDDFSREFCENNLPDVNTADAGLEYGVLVNFNVHFGWAF